MREFIMKKINKWYYIFFFFDKKFENIFDFLEEFIFLKLFRNIKEFYMFIFFINFILNLFI